MPDNGDALHPRPQLPPRTSRGALDPRPRSPCAGPGGALDRQEDTPLRLRVQLSLRGIPLADDWYAVQGTELRREVRLTDATAVRDDKEVLWAPEHPNLMFT